MNSIPKDAWAKLVVCLVIDGLGDSSFLLPGLGEFSDGVYAPLEAFLLGEGPVLGSESINKTYKYKQKKDTVELHEHRTVTTSDDHSRRRLSSLNGPLFETTHESHVTQKRKAKSESKRKARECSTVPVVYITSTVWREVK